MLIRTKLRELDERNLPCYVITQNENNISLYEHFEFLLIGNTNVPNSNINYYGMLRNKKNL